MEKIKKISEIQEVLSKVREGKKVGLCHGVFDVVHVGHLKHFESAKSKCDILVVSISPDMFVKKGPGKPVFNEQQRMWFLSQLEVIDYVTMNNIYSSIDIIEQVKPDFYFKGAEYRDKEDVTQKLEIEKNAVESFGGQLAFTDEVVYSSTKLINENIRVLTEEQTTFLSKFKTDYDIEKIKTELDRLKELNVLVIGDPIVDQYIYVNATNRANKSPNISSEYVSQISMFGGSYAIANHARSFVKNVTYFNQNQEPIVKTRFIAKNFKNAKLYEVSYKQEQSEVNIPSLEYLEQFDVILFTDFGHGYVNNEVHDQLIKSQKFLCGNVQTNSSNYGFNLVSKYYGFDLLVLDEVELRLNFADAFGDINGLALNLVNGDIAKNVITTLGANGLRYYEKNRIYRVPCFETNSVDTIGAGDAVFTLASLLSAVKTDKKMISFIANCAGGLQTKFVGNENYVDYSNIYKYMQGIIT